MLETLIRKSTEGGSYLIDTSLNYYNQWLAQVVGEYPPNVFTRNGAQVFRHYHSMNYTIPRYFKIIKQQGLLMNLDFFEKRT